MPDGRFDHQIQPLARTLNQSALRQRFGKTAITGFCWSMIFSAVIPGGNSTRADDFKAARKLADEHRAAEPVVPVRDWH